jgi:hypothetical protein
VSPNPVASGAVTVRYSLTRPGTAVLSIVDVAGRTVVSTPVMSSRRAAVTLDLGSLSAGVYLVKLTAGRETATQKLVVER